MLYSPILTLTLTRNNRSQNLRLRLISTIKSTIDRLGYSKDETDSLIKEMKKLFVSDDEFDTLEEHMFLGLKHILN